jgi:hypothetical protein
VEELLLSPVEYIGGRVVLGRQIQTAEPFVSEPTAAEVTIGKLKRYKAPGSDQISADLRSLHKQGNKTEYSNYRGISLLSTSYKMLSNILLSRLIPYADEITGDHHCGFRRNRSTTNQTDTGEKVRV